MSNYIDQLKDFQSYLDASFDVLVNHGDESDVEAFYNSVFEITFRGEKATLHNVTTVFQAIGGIIAAEIEESEER